MRPTKLSTKYQISIPKDLCEQQGWQPGQDFAFIPTGSGSYQIVPVPPLSALRGLAKGADPTGYRDRNDRY